MNPPTDHQWALCMSQWLLSHPCLSGTPLRHLLIASRHSVRLSAAVVPLALVTAACDPNNSGHSASAAPSNLSANDSYIHLHSELSDLLASHLLPSPTESSVILQNAPQIAQESSQLPNSASMHAANHTSPQTSAELTAAPQGVLRLVLCCLAALRTCSGSARVHRGTRVARLKPQVEWVCSWDCEAWLTLDYIQASSPPALTPCIDSQSVGNADLGLTCMAFMRSPYQRMWFCVRELVRGTAWALACCHHVGWQSTRARPSGCWGAAASPGVTDAQPCVTCHGHATSPSQGGDAKLCYAPELRSSTRDFHSGGQDM